MSRWMKGLALIGTAGMAAATVFYRIYQAGWLLTLAVALGTTAYHLILRLVIGTAADVFLKGPIRCSQRWFCPWPFEERLHRVLQVKKWKNCLPAYKPELFSLSSHSLSEIAGETCRAEIIHEVCAALSFLPLLFSLRFGSFFLFLFTSAAAACLDMALVIVQRYNRPRIYRLLKRAEQKNAPEKAGRSAETASIL